MNNKVNYIQLLRGWQVLASSLVAIFSFILIDLYFFSYDLGRSELSAGFSLKFWIIIASIVSSKLISSEERGGFDFVILSFIVYFSMWASSLHLIYGLPASKLVGVISLFGMGAFYTLSRFLFLNLSKQWNAILVPIHFLIFVCILSSAVYYLIVGEWDFPLDLVTLF